MVDAINYEFWTIIVEIKNVERAIKLRVFSSLCVQLSFGSEQKNLISQFATAVMCFLCMNVQQCNNSESKFIIMCSLW